LLQQQQQQQGPKSFSQNLSAKMNDEYLGIDGTRKHQKQNSDKTKKKTKEITTKNSENAQKKSKSKNNSKNQNNQNEMLTKPQKPTKKKKQVFPKHTTNLETLKLSLTKKSLQSKTTLNPNLNT
jgi:hypothetical protein